jgi:hypothetical protein
VVLLVLDLPVLAPLAVPLALLEVVLPDLVALLAVLQVL